MSKLFVDEIVHQSSQGSGTITLGASGETIALASGASVTGNGLVGITEADVWCLTATSSMSANTDTALTANWSRPSAINSYLSYFGTGMSESSGIFTFPSTGFYEVKFSLQGRIEGSTTSRRFLGADIYLTTDNSNYTSVTRGHSNIPYFESDTGTYSQALTQGIFDITDTSNQKLRFSARCSGAITIFGASNRMTSNVIFTRLGNT